jgi:hypothetical protein
VKASTSSSWRAGLIGRLGLPGKDAVQFARVPLAVCGAALVCVLATLIAHHYRPGALDPGMTALHICTVAVLAMAYTLGLALVGEENEDGTALFLLRLPVSPVAILAGKVVAGIVLLVAGAVVSVVAMGVLLGLGSGMGLRTFVVECVPDSGDRLEMVLFAVALFVGGMAAGSWVTRSTVAAAVVGAVAQSLWWLLVLAMGAAVLDTTLFEAHRGGFSLSAHASWAALMLGGLVLKFRGLTEPDSELWHRWCDLLVERWRARSPRVPSRSLLPGTLMAAVICSAIATLLVLGVDHIGQVNLLPMQFCVLAVLVLAGAVLGSGALAPGEREQTTFFLHHLPLDPWRFHRNRLRRLGIAAFFVGILTAAAFILTPGGVRGVSTLHLNWRPLACGSVVCAVSAMLAYWLRFFQRSRIVTIVVAALVASAWSLACVLVAWTYGAAVQMPQIAGIVDFIWPLLVALGLPVLLVLLTVRATLLLEADEPVRTAALLAAVPLALVWGPFLIALSPGDLLTILFG